MTEKEVVQVVTIIVMAYPASEKLKDETTLKAMVAAWYKFFKDDDAKIVEMAVLKHISVNKYVPNVAEIREQMAQILHPEIIPPDIAWAAVKDFIIAHGEFGSPDPYRELPAPIARVVKTIGYSQLYQLHRGHYGGNKDGMDRVAFMDLYKPLYEREMEKAMLPPALNAAIEHKRTEIGGQTLKMLEDIQERRTKEEHKYDFDYNAHERLLEYNHNKKLLGGTDNEED